MITFEEMAYAERKQRESNDRAVRREAYLQITSSSGDRSAYYASAIFKVAQWEPEFRKALEQDFTWLRSLLL